jgi:hypothetical protein
MLLPSLNSLSSISQTISDGTLLQDGHYAGRTHDIMASSILDHYQDIIEGRTIVFMLSGWSCVSLGGKTLSSINISMTLLQDGHYAGRTFFSLLLQDGHYAGRKICRKKMLHCA